MISFAPISHRHQVALGYALVLAASLPRRATLKASLLRQATLKGLQYYSPGLACKGLPWVCFQTEANPVGVESNEHGKSQFNPYRDLCESRSSARKSREGLLKVARRFIAGYRSKSETRPSGTIELFLWKCPSSVPTGRSSFRHQNPAMNCRATFNHSYGMIGSQTFAEISFGVAEAFHFHAPWCAQ
jgi:hypothetical protein